MLEQIALVKSTVCAASMNRSVQVNEAVACEAMLDPSGLREARLDDWRADWVLSCPEVLAMVEFNEAVWISDTVM